MSAATVARKGLSILQSGAAGEMENDSIEEREPAVAVPLIFYQMLKGDARAATFLAQVRFHQKFKGEWFFHTMDQWEEELGFSSDAEARCCKTLKEFGLETMVKAINRTPKKHYRINEEVLQKRIAEFRHFRESRKCEKQELESEPISLEEYRANGTQDSISEKVGGAGKSRAKRANTTGKVGSDTYEKVPSVTTEKVRNERPRKSENILKDLPLGDLGLEDLDPDANASGGRADAPPPPLEETSSEFKLALYLRDAIANFPAQPRNLPAPTVAGLRHWIDPAKGKGLRALLAEAEVKGQLDERKRIIRQIIDWLRAIDKPFWQSRFVASKNNPGRILYKEFAALAIESQPTQPNERKQHGNANHTPRPPTTRGSHTQDERQAFREQQRQKLAQRNS